MRKMWCEAEPDLWPIRPHPLPGEVFTGWLARVAQGHGIEPRFFFDHLRGRFRIPAERNLDADPSYELLAEVSRRTAVCYERLVGMTLRWHTDPWYAREVRYDPGGGFGFCSLCWAADPVPHVRRAWRLPWMACREHRIPLQWDCPRCRRERSIETLGPLPPVSQCECDFDLRCAAPSIWSGSRTSEEIAEYLDRWQHEFERAEARCWMGRPQ